MNFRIPDGIDAIVIQHCLQWLGHEGRISDDHLSKQLLFGEVLTTKPAYEL